MLKKIPIETNLELKRILNFLEELGSSIKERRVKARRFNWLGAIG